MKHANTICAIASAKGQAGVGVVRISGPLAITIAHRILGYKPLARHAHYGFFFDKKGVEIDKGVALFFPKPNSFTGEDVLELQGHGGIVVMNNIIAALISLGAFIAEPGEFSKRAFLNNKMDLAQAEAVADIISANSSFAARCALRSLSGDFSSKINALVKSLIALRVFVEATIDFSDEDIDFLAENKTRTKIIDISDNINDILLSSTQGAVLRDGINIAIVGKPNAGKSSLLNALTKDASAIVTDIAGTTRDVIKETIIIKGIPINIIDTAGIHNSVDKIEQEGIKRAVIEIDKADVVLMVFDAQDKEADLSILPISIKDKPLIIVKNKVDLTNEDIGKSICAKQIQLSICAKTALGIEQLEQELINIAGLSNINENVFLARKRHIQALQIAFDYSKNALMQLDNGAIELAAEDLRQAGNNLALITGEFSSDDLLGEIFSSFCIGK